MYHRNTLIKEVPSTSSTYFRKLSQMQEGLVCHESNYKIRSDYKRNMELGGPLELTSQSVFYLIKKLSPRALIASASDTSQSLLCHETVTIKKFSLKLNTVCLSVTPTYWF